MSSAILRAKCPNFRPAISPVKPLILAGLAVIMASNGAMAGGLGGGGGTVHTWTGNVSGNWHSASNWNTNLVPAAGQHAIIDGGPFNVFLNADTANLRSAFITGSRSLSTNGFVMTVTNNEGATTVNGVSSTLFVSPGGAPYAFDTDTLDLESSGRLQMAGGWAFVRDQLTMSTGGRVFGHGFITVDSPNAAAFNGTNGGVLTVSGGDLQIGVSGGGSMTLPDTINVNNAGQDLTLLGPIMLPIEDLNLGATAFSTDNDWTLAGQLTANPGAGQMARLGGSASVDVEGDVSVSANGHLRFDILTHLRDTADVNIASGATLELADDFVSWPGHSTAISQNGRLFITGVGVGNGWDGDISSSAGILEATAPAMPRIDGSVLLGSFGALRTVIDGGTPFRFNGPVDAPGLGAIVEGYIQLLADADMTLGANAQITVNGGIEFRSGSFTNGDGRIDVNAGGLMTIQEGATIAVDAVNGGELRMGVGSVAETALIFGDYEQEPSGRMVIQIAGPMFADHDSLSANAATLGGELNVDLLGAFVPVEGQEFTIINASSVNGMFSSLTGDPGFSLSYTPSAVVLTYEGVGMLGDVNGDGVVNVVDLLEVVSSWGACAGCDADIAPHPAGDGVVNVADLLLVISHWG